MDVEEQAAQKHEISLTKLGTSTTLQLSDKFRFTLPSRDWEELAGIVRWFCKSSETEYKKIIDNLVMGTDDSSDKD